MKTQEEIKKLTTKRLLLYYKAERDRMFRHNFKYGLLAMWYEDFDNELFGMDEVGWYGGIAHEGMWVKSSPNFVQEQIAYITMIKSELDSREHIKTTI